VDNQIFNNRSKDKLLKMNNRQDEAQKKADEKIA
jgi:hypothetical protein